MPFDCSSSCSLLFYYFFELFLMVVFYMFRFLYVSSNASIFCLYHILYSIVQIFDHFSFHSVIIFSSISGIKQNPEIKCLPSCRLSFAVDFVDSTEANSCSLYCLPYFGLAFNILISLQVLHIYFILSLHHKHVI